MKLLSKIRPKPLADARLYAVLRILFGLFSFWCLASLYPYSAEFFSSEGWLPPGVGLTTENIRTWSLFYVGHTPIYTWTFMTIAVLASVSMTIGFWSRTSTWITFAFLASASVRNHFVFSGEDCLLRNFLFLIALSRCGDAWSLDSWWAKKKAGLLTSAEIPEATPVAPAWPLHLMQIQVCLLYLSSGLAKQRGTDWLTGIATIRALMNPVVSRFSYDTLNHFAWFFKSDFFRLSELVTLHWELLFPLFMVQKQLRYAALAFGVMAHTLIFFMFQVHFFSFAILSTYLCLIPTAWTLKIFSPAIRAVEKKWDSLFTFKKNPPSMQDRGWAKKKMGSARA